MGLITTLKLYYRSPCCEKPTKHQFTLDNQRKPPFATMAKNRPFLSCLFNVIFIPNRTFLVCFGGILGECGLDMARILARRSQAKIPMAKPNEPDMSPKRTKKERLGIYRTQIQPKWPWCRGISGQWLDIVDIRTVELASDWLIANLGTVRVKTSLRARLLILKCISPSRLFSCKSTHFHMKGFAQWLGLKQRHQVTSLTPDRVRN